MKILVTGGSGFLGSHLAADLRLHHQVEAPASSELDLMDEDAVRSYLASGRFDAVVHAAGAHANRRLGAPPDLLHRNCRIFLNLARCQDEFGRLVFLSSGAVYDRRGPVSRMGEDGFDRHVPVDDYGLSKYICARLIAGWEKFFELRLFAVFGPHEDFEVRFLSNACCRAVWDLPVTVRRNCTFDYMDVADLAPVVDWFLQAQPRRRAYNVCSGRPLDLVTLADKVVRASGKDLPVKVKESGLGAEYSGDNRRLLAEMPFRFRDMDESIRSLYHWYEDRKPSIDPGKLHFDA